MQLCQDFALELIIVLVVVVADQIKENEVGRACGMHGRGEECVQGFDGKARRKETTWNIKS
jgi:hypothetical protein